MTDAVLYDRILMQENVSIVSIEENTETEVFNVSRK